MIKISKLCKDINVTRQTVYNWSKSDKIKLIKSQGGQYFVDDLTYSFFINEFKNKNIIMDELDFNSEDNKYFKWYWNICNNALNRELHIDTYVERHHVYPKSIFGENKDLVKLTAREHYIVHVLLWKGLRQKFGKSDARTVKMAYACSRMKGKSKRSHVEKTYSSRDFEFARIALSEANREYYKKYGSPNTGRKHSEETRQKISVSKSGEKNPFYGKFLSDNHKEKLSLAKINKPKTNEKNLKNSEAHLGKQNTVETIEKIRQTLKETACNKKKLVYEYDINFNLLKTWSCKAECEKYYNKRVGQIYIRKNTPLIESGELTKLRILEGKILSYVEIKK